MPPPSQLKSLVIGWIFKQQPSESNHIILSVLVSGLTWITGLNSDNLKFVLTLLT